MWFIDFRRKFIVLLLGFLLVSNTVAFNPKIVKNEITSHARFYQYFDDTSNILTCRFEGEYKLMMSYDDGATWSTVKIAESANIDNVVIDELNNGRAIAFSKDVWFFTTTDAGVTWKKYRYPEGVITFKTALFNAEDPHIIMLESETCDSDSFKCKKVYYYTEKNFKDGLKKVDIDAEACVFAKSNLVFKGGHKTTIYCTINKYNSFGHVMESSLQRSDDFFKPEGKGKVPPLDLLKMTSGVVIDVRIKESFLIAVVQSDKFNKKSKVSLHVSTDGEYMDQTDLDIDIQYGWMSFLDSSRLSLYVSIVDVSNSETYSESTIYASDSLGLRFLRILEKVQFQAIIKDQTIDGIWLSRVYVDGKHSNTNNKEGLYDAVKRHTKGVVSIDNGKSWRNLRVINDPDCTDPEVCSFHVMSIIEANTGGKFVTGPTPGILLAIGNKGEFFDIFDRSSVHTWISRDGGMSWEFALKEPSMFSFGDQGNIIVAVPYSKEADVTKVYFSLTQGLSWESIDLDTPILPLSLITTVDGSSSKFLLLGASKHLASNKANGEIIYSIDFADAFGGKKCASNDMENYHPRVDPDSNEQICVNGHRETFTRRKRDSECLVRKLFKDVKAVDTPCECTVDDFEWSFWCNVSDNACQVNNGRLRRLCPGKSIKMRLEEKTKVNGNLCYSTPKSISLKLKTVECRGNIREGNKENEHGVNMKGITISGNEFSGQLQQYTYLEGIKKENVILKTRSDQVYLSYDGGVSFSLFEADERVLAYYIGYSPNLIILLTASEVFYISTDSGNTFTKREAPSSGRSLSSRRLAFNKNNSAEFIWFSDTVCSSPIANDCKLTAYYTSDSGKTFALLKKDVILCDFIYPFLELVGDSNDKLIFCSVKDLESGKIDLLSSTDYFLSSKKIMTDIAGYVISGSFIIVATIDEERQSLKAKVSVDGLTFAEAEFPPDFHVDVERAFTILDSSSKAIFMHVTTRLDVNHELGSILKSNSNGTSYVLSLLNVNRNSIGFVDYDRIESIEGVIISNIVTNPESKADKKIKTQISHNDGAEWSYITPPKLDSESKKYKCTNSRLEKCSLHLHGYTERRDFRDTPSSPTAVGVIIAVGNVGEYLGDRIDASTFLSRDGGITWKEIRKGNYMWEYGDQGTIIILVESYKPTKHIIFSIDDGKTWEYHTFSKKKLKVLDIATVPSDTSRKFLLFAYDGEKTLTFSIDFSRVHNRQCQLDLDNPDDDDYEYWSPRHPQLADNCLFGHEVRYLRRAAGHYDCFIGSAPLKDGRKVVRYCPCTRSDFECDYNYFRDVDNTCKLVKGLNSVDKKKQQCEKENGFQYFEATGYRKIPLSTCEGGKQLDKWISHACPGKEKEYQKHYGKEIKGVYLALLIVLPICLFIGVTWFVYDRGIRRNGGFNRLGQIRLDEGDFQPIENNGLDKIVNKAVRGGILVAAGIFATLKTIKQLDTMLLDKVKRFLFGSFSRGRNFVRLPNDDDEALFGDFEDSFEENLDANLTPEVSGMQEQPDSADLTTEAPDPRLFGVDEQSDQE